MFILVVISDIVRIPPEDFNRETSGLMIQLEMKYANKVYFIDSQQLTDALDFTVLH